MTPELIAGYPAANDREQMGRFLRYAIPLGTESFAGLVSKNDEYDHKHEQPKSDSSVEKVLLSMIR